MVERTNDDKSYRSEPGALWVVKQVTRSDQTFLVLYAKNKNPTNRESPLLMVPSTSRVQQKTSANEKTAKKIAESRAVGMSVLSHTRL